MVLSERIDLADDYRTLSSIMSAAFSAIINVGALVLAEVINGMIDASTTRSPDTPCTRKFGATTAVESMPILHVPTG